MLVRSLPVAPGYLQEVVGLAHPHLRLHSVRVEFQCQVDLLIGPRQTYQEQYVAPQVGMHFLEFAPLPREAGSAYRRLIRPCKLQLFVPFGANFDDAQSPHELQRSDGIQRSLRYALSQWLLVVGLQQRHHRLIPYHHCHQHLRLDLVCVGMSQKDCL